MEIGKNGNRDDNLYSVMISVTSITHFYYSYMDKDISLPTSIDIDQQHLMTRGPEQRFQRFGYVYSASRHRALVIYSRLTF